MTGAGEGGATLEGVSLQTSDASRLLEQRYALEVERRQEDIQHTESQLRAALKELELLRHEEERQLGQRSSRLQRDYETSMAALERRFLADAQVLQARLKEGLDRETALSQAAIDTRARELLGALGPASAGGVAMGTGGIASAAATAPPSADLTAATTWQTSQRSPPRASSSRSLWAQQPPPAVAAATEAIAALRLQLPPSPAKLRAQSGGGRHSGHSRPAVNLTAVSGITAAESGSDAPGCGLPAQPPAHSLPKSPALSVRFAVPAGSGSGGSSDGLEQGGRCGVAASGGAALGMAPCMLAHCSSSEFEDDSYWHDTSSDAEMLTSKAPPVKLVNPGSTTRRSGSMTPRSASLAAVRPTSAGGSKPAVHLNLVPSSTPSPDSPKLRAVYSPCTCTGPVAMGVAALSPRAAAAGARAACCGLARSPAGARSYTSD